MTYLNVAFYRFTPLEDPGSLAERLKKELAHLPVKGTVILATEGINGFLAGEEPAVRAFLAGLRAHESFAGLEPKESFSQTLPFQKLCFKVKPEIVTFRVDGVPSTDAPALSPEEFERWQEEEDFILIDTRNEYEFKVGAFEGALSFKLNHFVEFADAAKTFPEEWRKKKIVTYCTGGIRCEKAAPYLRGLGYDAYQLEGGILKYFEKVGGSHWSGECFVFDERVGLLPDLSPSGAKLCAGCQGPVPASSSTCPHCGA